MIALFIRLIVSQISSARRPPDVREHHRSVHFGQPRHQLPNTATIRPAPAFFTRRDREHRDRHGVCVPSHSPRPSAAPLSLSLLPPAQPHSATRSHLTRERLGAPRSRHSVTRPSNATWNFTTPSAPWHSRLRPLLHVRFRSRAGTCGRRRRRAGTGGTHTRTRPRSPPLSPGL